MPGINYSLLLLAVIWIAAAPPAPTELLIRAVDRSGAAVPLTRADVYFDTWGGNEVTHLPHDRTSVRIRLDRDGACSLDPALCANDTFSARFVLEAEGQAPVSSDLFEWAHAGGAAVTIRFPAQAPLRVRPGTRANITLRFREKQPRAIALVDRAGAPIPDAVVTVRNLFAQSNHTGFPEGEVLLEDARTDAGGRLAVPDGDIEYSFMIFKPHWQAVGRGADTFQNHVHTRIAGGAHTIVLRHRLRKTLMLALDRDGGAAAGVPVNGCLAQCSGGCCGPLGKTDHAGHLTIRDFYPEEYERVFVPVKDGEFKALWEIDPRKLPAAGRRLTVPLPR
jgi:hypothetical protein